MTAPTEHSPVSLLFETLRTLSLAKSPSAWGKEPVMPLCASDSTSKERDFESWGRFGGEERNRAHHVLRYIRGKEYYDTTALRDASPPQASTRGSCLRKNNVAVGHMLLAD